MSSSLEPLPFVSCPSATPLDRYAKLSKEAINALPLFHYEGKISLVRTVDDVASAVERLSRESVLGFDTETPPVFRKGKSHAPTLVQLAGEKEVVLFHFKWQPLSSALISLFENASIIKTGVAVHDDMRFLSKIAPFAPHSVVDLSLVAQKNNVENFGLRGLVASFLGLRISKGEQCSNWGNAELTPRQIRYAATDAWASRAVYFSMCEAGLDFTPTPVKTARLKPSPKHPRRKAKRPQAAEPRT